jgi:hypothetical protein
MFLASLQMLTLLVLASAQSWRGGANISCAAASCTVTFPERLVSPVTTENASIVAATPAAGYRTVPLIRAEMMDATTLALQFAPVLFPFLYDVAGFIVVPIFIPRFPAPISADHLPSCRTGLSKYGVQISK